MAFKKDKWHNFGDVNHREHGGVFVKRETPPKSFEHHSDTMEIVSVHNNEDIGLKGYTHNSRSDSVDDLQELWEMFIQNPKLPIATCCDWDRLKNMDAEDRLFHIAVDKMYYYGGECEQETSTNYYEMLRSYRIYL